MFFKISVLINFAILTEKHLSRSVFLIKFQHRCFPINIAKSFCRTPPVTASKSSFYAIGILNPWTFCWFWNENLKVFRSEIGGKKHGRNYSRSKLNDLKLKSLIHLLFSWLLFVQNNRIINNINIDIDMTVY